MGKQEKNVIGDDKLEHEIDKVALTMSRLNNMWSFTGSQLSYACDNYMRPYRLAEEPEDRIDCLLQAYAALTKSVTFLTSQGYDIPDFWDRMFAKLGQDIIYTLPQLLHPKKEKRFDKNLLKRFTLAWGESPSPLP